MKKRTPILRTLFGWQPSLERLRDQEIDETERTLAIYKSRTESYIANTEMYAARLARLKKEKADAQAALEAAATPLPALHGDWKELV